MRRKDRGHSPKSGRQTGKGPNANETYSQNTMNFGQQLLISLGCTAFLAGCGYGEGVAAFYSLTSPSQSPAQLNALLRVHDQWYLPPSHGNGKHPGVLLVPGCAGTRPFHQVWAEFLRTQGFVVLLIDSFAARNISEAADLESVCEGERLWGFERAGDVLVSLQTLRAHPRVDPKSLHLVGWSHGGWSVMDAVSLAGANKRPPLLTELPETSLKGVQSTFALYPYCGFGSFTGRYQWPASVRGLLILAQRDQNIEPGPCIDLVHNQRSEGRPLRQKSYDVDHWFDNPTGQDIVPHDYDDTVRDEVRSLLVHHITHAD